jgi:dTDP-4-amino-4,6-dideoxygalactose transaminase
MHTLNVPRLPVFGWNTICSDHFPLLPSVLNMHNLVWTSSGRAAIAYALQEIGIKTGDLVLVPTYHCPTMVAPIVHAGGQPLFYPISNSGAPLLEYMASLDLSGVRCMIAAHFFGLMQPMKAIREFCDQHGIFLIEDCAHAIFGTVDGQPVGTWGDYAIASLTKFFPVMEGGCLASARHPLHCGPERAKSIANELKVLINVLETSVKYRRLTGVNSGLAVLFSIKDAFFHRHVKVTEILLDSPIKIPDVAREALTDFKSESPVWLKPGRVTRWLCKHANTGSIIALRRRNFQRLIDQLSDTPGVRPLFSCLPEGCAPYVFPLIVDAPDRYYQRLKISGAPVFRWDWRWPDTPEESWDSGTQWSRQVFQIGCHQDLKIDDIDAIVNIIKTLLQDEDIK